jgi:hypothetical protein
LLLGSCLGCAPAQRWLDHKGLEDYATTLSQDLVGRTLETPGPLQDLNQDTAPNKVIWSVTGPPDFQLPDDELVQETLSFPSAISTHPDVGTATFWVYRHGALGARPVILWLPGNGFAPIAFPFVRHFYSSIIDAGYDLVVWVPPFHMNRTNGQNASILGVDTNENVRILSESVREVRTLIHFLMARNVPHIGGWGGSMGAAILWLVSAVETIDHMSLMIPVLDWRTVTIDPPQMKNLNEAIAHKNITLQELEEAYLSISPIAHPSKTSPDRIQILYAIHDQLTPESTTLDFAQARKIESVTGYNRSHATMLLGVSLYVDYANFLRSMKNR